MNDSLQIRLAELKDIPQILTIRKDTFLHFAPSSYTPTEVQTLIEDVKLEELEDMIKNKSLFVAEEDSKVIGCGGWFKESVKHMYVSPNETKKGVGSKLLKTLEDDYKTQTHNSVIKAGVILYARPFYEKNGYDFLRIDTDWDGSKFNQMEKRLS